MGAATGRCATRTAGSRTGLGQSGGGGRGFGRSAQGCSYKLEIVADGWSDARHELAKDAAVASLDNPRFASLADKGAYPQNSPWTPDQVLDEGFWPEPAKS